MDNKKVVTERAKRDSSKIFDYDTSMNCAVEQPSNVVKSLISNDENSVLARNTDINLGNFIGKINRFFIWKRLGEGGLY
jgi:hypothetical protein